MQFLYPKVLWALFTLIIPIIIHLFNFRRYTTVYFSNVSFLQNIRKESKSKSTLKNLFLLLLRLLVLAFLVFAFAKPYIPNSKNEQLSENPHVAIYIDNSFSMEAEGKYGILLESAKVKAKEIASILPRSTKYLLVTNEFSVVHQRFVGSEQFVDWVSQIHSTHIVRNLNEVYSKISINFPSIDVKSKPQVYLISDFQNILFENFEDNQAHDFNVAALPVINKTLGNLNIDSVWFETPGHYKGKEERIHILLKNYSTDDYRDIPLMLHVNDTLRSSVVFNIEANKSKEVVIPFTNWNSGWVKTHIAINDYPITFDNTLYFSFEIKDKKSVLIINGDQVEHYFEALYKNDENIVYQAVDKNDIPYNNFQSFEVVILNQLSSLPSGLISEIVDYVKRGGYLAFIPSIEADLSTYTLLTNKLQAIQFAEFIEQEGSVAKVDFNDKLFNTAIDKEMSKIRYPQYKGFYPISFPQKSNVKTLFRTESDFPAFVTFAFGTGQFYFSGIPIHSEISDLGTHPLFVPLFYNIALFASEPSDLYSWINPQLHSRLKLNKNSAVSPNLVKFNEQVELKPKFNVASNMLTLYPSVENLKAGHYTVFSGNHLLGYVSYNYDRSESDMTYMLIENIREKLAQHENSYVEVIDIDDKAFEKLIKKETNGTPLSQLFFFFVAIFLLSEMVLLRFFT